MVVQSELAGRSRRSRWSAVAVALALVSAACGGGDDQEPASETSEPPQTTEPPATEPPQTTEPPATEPPQTTEPPATEAPTTTGEDPDEIVNADPVLVDLADFQITVDTTVFRAGTVNFEVTNTDDVPHEFGITRGDSYEELPLEANGAIDEDALGDDLLGKTGAIFGALGTTKEVSFDLAPGNYVFFCNLGPAFSHAARGQVLSVTVVE